VAKLREAENLQAQGVSIPALCKRLQISDQTFYRWRLKYGVSAALENWTVSALEK
jgi:transposase-like protein